jgi:hypothetical protein
VVCELFSHVSALEYELFVGGEHEGARTLGGGQDADAFLLLFEGVDDGEQVGEGFAGAGW